MNQSIHQMQRYILGCVGLMAAMGATYPIAMARISADPEFSGQAVVSQDCANQPVLGKKVVAWGKDCAPLTVAPIGQKP